MDFRLLGPLEVSSDGRPLPLGGAKQRGLLALLLIRANQTISTDRLIDELWGESPPTRATKALQMHVLGLRKTLGEGRVQTHGHGYRLRVERRELDVDRAQALSEEAARRDPAAAAPLLREALALFRGEPLADISYEPFAEAEATRLREWRLQLLEERVEVDLALGRHRALVSELESCVVEHPLRERLRAQLMLALYRSGRQAEALETYRVGRKLLVESLGLEPGSELRELEARILRHDPALGSTRAPFWQRVPRRRRRLVAFLAAIVLVSAATAVLAAVILPSHEPPAVVPDSLVRIDANTNVVSKVTRTGREPLVVAASREYLWVLNQGDETVSRIERASGMTRTVGGLSAPHSFALGPDGTLWIGSEATSFVVGLDVETLRFVGRIRVPGPPPAFVAIDRSSLWISQPNVGEKPGTVSVVDLGAGRAVRRYVVGGYTAEIAVGDGSAWVGLGDDDALGRIPMSGGAVQRIGVGPLPSSPAVGFGSAWIASYAEGKVWRVSTDTGRVESIINVGIGPWGVAIGRDAVWVTNRSSGSVSRINPQTNAVERTIVLGYKPQGITVDGDDVWVTVANSDIGI